MNFCKASVFLAFLICCNACGVIVREPSVDLAKVRWIHGSPDCKTNRDPLLQVVRLNEATWVLRQNKCTHYEAPFMFLFLGREKALLMDTGASGDEASFPLYTTVKGLISDWEKGLGHPVELVVAHTHSHSDHTAADRQFKGKEGVTVVGLKVEEVASFFGISNWPIQTATFDLGGRQVQIIPLPGHHETSIALYDPQTRIVLTGDSFYPGRLYIKDWAAFKESTQRLVNFAKRHEVSLFLGNHIELTTEPGKDYPVGATFQPDEHPLPLRIKDLKELNATLNALGEKPSRKVMRHYIIYPK